MIGMNMAKKARQRRTVIWLLSKVINSYSRKLCNYPAKCRHAVCGCVSSEEGISGSGVW